jgi:RNA polymerase sigma factor (sigma-70 family)
MCKARKPALLNDLSSEKLFSLYKKTGEDRYFTAIHERHRVGMEHLLMKMLDSERHDIIEDILQNVFLQLHGVPSVLALGNISLNGWLLQAAQCRAHDEIRRIQAKKRSTGVREASLLDDARVNEFDPGEAVSRREVADQIQKMVHRLPLNEQEAIQLSLAGLSRREAADELGITPGNYQGSINRAMLCLQEMTSTRLEASIV